MFSKEGITIFLITVGQRLNYCFLYSMNKLEHLGNLVAQKRIMTIRKKMITEKKNYVARKPCVLVGNLE